MVKSFYSMFISIVIATVVILGILFFANNVQTLQIRLFSMTKEIYLATWTLYSVLGGFFITAFIFGATWVRANSGTGQMKRKIEALQREVDYLRNRPILEDSDVKGDKSVPGYNLLTSETHNLLDETESA